MTGILAIIGLTAGIWAFIKLGMFAQRMKDAREVKQRDPYERW